MLLQKRVVRALFVLDRVDVGDVFGKQGAAQTMEFDDRANQVQRIWFQHSITDVHSKPRYVCSVETEVDRVVHDCFNEARAVRNHRKDSPQLPRFGHCTCKPFDELCTARALLNLLGGESDFHLVIYNSTADVRR